MRRSTESSVVAFVGRWFIDQSGVRRFLRWSLLVGFVVGMGAWSLGYAAGGVQFAAVVLGFLAWLAWGAVAASVWLMGFRAARSGPWRYPARRSWSRWLWLAAPACFWVCCLVRVDAWVWFLTQRAQLERLVTRAPQSTAEEWTIVDGRTVRWTPAGVLLVRLGGWMFEERGVAFDPHGRLQVGAEFDSRRILGVTELSGGWRAWYTDD